MKWRRSEPTRGCGGHDLSGGVSIASFIAMWWRVSAWIGRPSRSPDGCNAITRAISRMRVSPETIYQWIYRDAADGGILFHHLRRHHRRRYKQGRYGSGRGLIPGRVSIAERPAIVERRSRFGDWEGDTLEGGRGKEGISASLVERKSRYLFASPLPDKTADTMAFGATEALKEVPPSLRKTLTVDNGKEFAGFKIIQNKRGSGFSLPIRTPPGSAAATKTPTDFYVSTSQRGPTYPT